MAMARATQKLVGLGQRTGNWAVNTVSNTGPRIAKDTVAWSKPKLSTFWYYAKVELAPPTPGEIPAVQKGIQNIIKSAKSGKYMQLTTKEAWVNGLICAEITFWFFVGEQIGRRSLIGYNVKSDYERPSLVK